MLVLRRALCARATLGVPVGATRAAIRARYYELAKQTHPDVCQDGHSDGEADFLAMQAAFEELMAESSRAAPTTAANSAARGGGAAQPQAQRRQPPRAPARAAPSLGEILVQRLEHEPSAYREVWAEILERRLALSATITCALFRACAASGDGMPAALSILRESEAEQALPQAVRSASLVALLTLCREEGAMSDATFEVVEMLTDEDRADPEVFGALASTFSQFPSGSSF